MPPISCCEIEVPPDDVAARSYVDSIFLRLPALMDSTTFEALKVELRKNIEPKKRRVLMNKRGKEGFFWHLEYPIHQPTRAALALLEEAGYTDLLAVHVALDLVSRTSDPTVLRAYVEHRILKNARPARVADCESDSVQYFGRRNLPDSGADDRGLREFRNDGSEIALYSDNLSKVHRRWCLHLEFRAKGAEALRSEGLASFEQLRDLDHSTFWDKRLDMRKPPDEATLLQLCKRGFVARGYGEDAAANAARRTIYYVLRASRGVEHSIVGNNLLAQLARCRPIIGSSPIRLFRKECHDWMLPEVANALWTSEYRERVAAEIEPQRNEGESSRSNAQHKGAQIREDEKPVRTQKRRAAKNSSAGFAAPYRLSDEECLQKLLELSLGSEGECSQCKTARKHFRVRGRPAFACGTCGHHLYPQAGTVFEGTRTPLSYWFSALEIIQANRNCSAAELAASLPVSYKTACRMRSELIASLKTGEGLPNELLAFQPGASLRRQSPTRGS